MFDKSLSVEIAFILFFQSSYLAYIDEFQNKMR